MYEKSSQTSPLSWMVGQTTVTWTSKPKYVSTELNLGGWNEIHLSPSTNHRIFDTQFSSGLINVAINIHFFHEINFMLFLLENDI